MCERCQSIRLGQSYDLGGAVLVRCDACGHAQLMRKQQPRGYWQRVGEFAIMVCVAAGVIDV